MLVKALEKGVKKHEKEHEWDDSKIHVSDLCVALNDTNKGCPRALWLRVNGYEKKEKHIGQELMYFFANNIHELTSSLLQKGGIKVLYTEVPVKLDLTDITNFDTVGEIVGRYDCMIEYKGKRAIIDYKTVRGNAFRYMDGCRTSYALQVQGYMMATDTYYGAVLIIDREGQNFVRQFNIERDDEQVIAAAEKAIAYANRADPPERIKPKVSIKENKGADAVYADIPWQCEYCDHLDASCDGALPPEFRGNRVKGNIDDTFVPKPEFEGIEYFLEVDEL